MYALKPELNKYLLFDRSIIINDESNVWLPHFVGSNKNTKKKNEKKTVCVCVYSLYSVHIQSLNKQNIFHSILLLIKCVSISWIIEGYKNHWIELASQNWIIFFFFQKIAIIQWWNLLLTLDHKSVFINYLKLLYNDGGDEKIIKLIFNDIFEIKEFINSIKWIAYSIMIGK